MKEQRGELRYKTKDNTVRVIISHAQFQCTGCLEWKPAAEFGCREIKTRKSGKVIRNQPRCVSCR